jgi:hypothetical protein
MAENPVAIADARQTGVLRHPSRPADTKRISGSVLCTNPGLGSDVDCCPAATTLSGCDSRLHGAGPSDDAGWFVKSLGTGIEIIFSQNDVQTIREWDDPVV